MGESLRDAVEAAARAHVAGDDAAFASWMTPQALLQLRGGAPFRPRSFDLLSLEERDASGTSAVMYRGAGRFVLRQRWERRNGGWKAVEASIPPETVRLPLWRRIFSRARDRSPRERGAVG